MDKIAQLISDLLEAIGLSGEKPAAQPVYVKTRDRRINRKR